MIHYLKGSLAEKTPTYVVIDCNGVAYLVNISLNTYSQLPDNGTVKVHTYLAIKEDAHTLYGFADVLERRLFMHLISVNGIGPGTARMMLSSIQPEELQNAILSGNIVLLTKVKGVGAKTAQRLVIELRDKLVKGDSTNAHFSPVQHNTVREEALSALTTLGFARNAAEKVVDKELKTQQDLTVEKLIKLALQSL